MFSLRRRFPSEYTARASPTAASGEAASTSVSVPPGRVFEVLANPESYQHWVVGASEVVKSDPGWPAIGTAFEHRVATAH